MRGVYRQHPAQPHVELRRKLLDGATTWPAPVPTVGSATDPSATAEAVLTQLRATGLAAVALDRPMTSSEYVSFGGVLGTPQPEKAASVRPRVEHGVILDLTTTHAATDDPDVQPFAAGHLSLHSESSASPPAVQPRFISLLCVEPGYSTAAQTVLVAMDAVAASLSADDRTVLAATRYDGHAGAPRMLREEHGHAVFSIRDFQDDPLDWKHTGPASTEAEVNVSLDRLYAAMYCGPAAGVTWRTGLLVVIDNQRYFHGRSAGRPPGPGVSRHLRRLRISAPAGAG